MIKYWDRGKFCEYSPLGTCNGCLKGGRVRALECISGITEDVEVGEDDELINPKESYYKSSDVDEIILEIFQTIDNLDPIPIDLYEIRKGILIKFGDVVAGER